MPAKRQWLKRFEQVSQPRRTAMRQAEQHLSRYDPNTHPAVQAAYAAHRAASEEFDRLAAPDAEPGTPEAQAAHEAEYRLYRADKAHREVWRAVTGSGDFLTRDNWLDIYPSLEAEMRRDFVQAEAEWEIGE